jgi:asparagine synthase (glutamine-hydrolysing)
MGICGSSSLAEQAPREIDRTLFALARGSARSHRNWTQPGIRFGCCDDGTVAANPANDAAAFDGRIDNRDELSRALSAGDLNGRTNAETALLCYEKWGDDFCDHIIGDYACAIWKAQRRRLVMTVDPGALRPLYYWLAGSEILFASEQRGLFADPQVPRTLDEDQIATWLCLLPRDPQRTFFRGIFRIPPGHRAIWENGAARLERWWRPEHLPVLRLAAGRDYEDAVRTAFQEAVRCRLGHQEKVGAHLSGGLDSPSVTATAALLLAKQGQRLAAFTAVPTQSTVDEPHRFGDEWQHAAAVAAMYPNIDHVRVANDDRPLFDAMALRETVLDSPVTNPANAIWINAIDREARARGITVMLMSQMGNMTFSYGGGELLAGQLRRARFLAAVRTILDLHRAGGRSWLGLLGDVADAVLPAAARRTLRRAVGTPEPDLFDLTLIDPSFVRAKGLEPRIRDMAFNTRNLARGNSRAVRLAMFDRSEQRSQWACATRRLYGIDIRDPTSDRRLMELCLSIPDEQFLHNGVERSLARRAMAGLLPDAIVNERRRGLQSADWRHGFDAAIPDFTAELGRLRASPLGRRCLDIPRMQDLLQRWPGQGGLQAATRHTYTAFSRGIATGRFIRRIEGGNG